MVIRTFSFLSILFAVSMMANAGDPIVIPIQLDKIPDGIKYLTDDSPSKAIEFKTNNAQGIKARVHCGNIRGKLTQEEVYSLGALTQRMDFRQEGYDRTDFAKHTTIDLSKIRSVTLGVTSVETDSKSGKRVVLDIAIRLKETSFFTLEEEWSLNAGKWTLEKQSKFSKIEL